MKILFRISGGAALKKNLGLGHIYRSMNLASNLRQNEIHFMIEDYGNVTKILQERNFSKIYTLKKNIKLNEEIKELNFYIKKNKIQLIVFDKYRINPKIVSEIKKKCKTVVISDLKKFNYKVDLVINGFIGFKNKKIINSSGTKCLLGPSYQILDNKFCNKDKKIKKKKFLLVTFGGFDENNLISIFLKAAEKYFEKFNFKIILGTATKEKTLFKKYKKKFPEKLEIIKYSSNMYKEISEAEYGLCSGGITTYEFSSMKIPFGVICQAKHQIITANIWEKKGMAFNLGMKNKFTEKKIQMFLEKISNETKLPKKPFLDGCGAKRVAKEIMKL